MCRQGYEITYTTANEPTAPVGRLRLSVPQVLTRRSADRSYKSRWPPSDSNSGTCRPGELTLKVHNDLAASDRAKRVQNANMDYPATTAGVTSALELGVSLSGRANAVIEAWHDTPPLMYALHNELSDLIVVLDNTHSATEVSRLSAGTGPDELLSDLEQHLTRANQLLAQAEGLVAELLAAPGVRQRRRVLSRNGQTASLKDRLRDARVSLHNCLLLHNVYGYPAPFSARPMLT